MESQKEIENNLFEGIQDSRSKADSDEDEKVLFSAVLTALHLERLPAFCISVRKQFTENDQIESIVVEQPLFGSYHVLFPITFQDGIRWLMKIPACGTSTHFDFSAAAALRSEALTMRLLRRETSVPVLDVLAFEASLDNELGCPFILMNFIEGISLYDCWFDRVVSSEQLHMRRTQTLKNLAQAMAELGRFSFDSGGSPMFDQDDNLKGTSSMRCVDHKGMLDRMASGEDDDETALYFDAGPFSDPRLYYFHSIDREEKPKQSVHKGLRILLQMFLSWIPELEDHCQKFVLTHPDLDIQNVIVSVDGRLQGLIDWDGVAALPCSIGNESYPSWLTRDWDPAMYGWNEDMERGIEPAGLWEDSSETLVRHRKEYESFMRLQLSSERDQILSNIHSLPVSSYPSSLTAKSLFVANLLIAAENSTSRFEILKKFVDEILQIVRKDPKPLTIIESKDRSENTKEKIFLENLDIFDISELLVGGEFNRQHVAILRKGFEALLNDS